MAALDKDNKPLPAGKVGEVCIQGPNVTKGYLNRPEANEEAFAGTLLLFFLLSVFCLCKGRKALLPTVYFHPMQYACQGCKSQQLTWRHGGHC